jgi:hypothetical protein
MSTLRPQFSASTALTVTLANLASSAAQVGRQATLVDNSVERYDLIHLQGRVTTGTSPTTGRAISVWLIKGDGTRRTDGAGASDAAFTAVSARLLKLIGTGATSDKAYDWDAVIVNPGPEWGIAITHDTAVNLKNNAADQWVYWQGQRMEVVA